MSKFAFRALVIAIAYFLAVIGAYVIIILSLAVRVALNDPGESLGYVLSVTFLLAILGAGIPSAKSLALPAIAIIAGEIVPLRSKIYYVAVGAVTGIMVFFTTQSEKSTDAHAGYFSILAALSLLAGITGGLIYWRFAGRTAGADAGETSDAGKSSETSETKK